MNQPPARPSDLELQVLGVLWERGPLTARQVLEGLPDHKDRAYTTVLSVMQTMEKKGLLTRKVDDVTHIWRPAVTRRQITGPLLKGLVRNVFGGRPSQALQQLLSDPSVDADEMAAIRRLIDDHAPRKGGAKRRRD
jgi:predicted transcriptional regulator